MRRVFSLVVATFVLASLFVVAIDDLSGIDSASASTQAGTLDSTFPGSSPGYLATGVAISSSGPIAIVDAGLAIYSSTGAVTRISASESMSAVAVQTVGGVERFLTGSSTMKRYSIGGALDTTFATGQTGTHRAILPAFGKIYAGASNDFKRYSENGALEATVPMGSAVNGLAAQTVDGVDYILVGGGFGLRRYFASNSTQDTTFTQNPGATVNSIAVQADGKILVGGTFGLRRYEAGGAVDATFATVSGTISAVLVQSDGKILTGTSANLKRYSSTGVPESIFNTNTAKDGTFAIANNAMAIDSSGRIVIAGPSNLAVKRFIRRYSGVYTPPLTPPTPTAVAGDTQVTVTVASASTGAVPTFHTVSVVGDPTKTCTVSGVSGSCTITGLTNGTSYSFQTIATNFDADSAPSPSVSSTPLDLPPVFVSGVVDALGTTMTLTYNKTLSDPAPLASAFSVTNGGVPVIVSSAAISDGKVVLALASAIGVSKAATVAYSAPATVDNTLTNNAIQSVLGLDAVSLTARTVTNNSTVDQTAPTFISAAVSTNGLSITMTYNEALSSTTADAGQFTVTNGGAPISVTGASVSGSTVVLTLASAIGAGKSATVAYAAPTADNTVDTNAAVQDTTGNDAVTLTARTITNSSTVDQTGPVFSSGVVNAAGTTLTLTYNEALNATTADVSQFTVANGGVPVTVTNATVSGLTVVLTLATPVGAAKSVTVAYSATSPVDNTTANSAVQDTVGNDAVTLTARTVTNNSTVDQTAPVFSSGVVNAAGTTLTLTYNEALNATTAAASQFTVTNGGVPITVTNAVVSGSTVVLTLETPAGAARSVTVAYAATSPVDNTTANSAVQDIVGNDAVTLTARTVTNNSTDDQTGPVMNSGVVSTSGETITLTYNEALSAVTAGTGDFIVQVGGVLVTVTSVTVSGSTVVLGVSPVVNKSLSVTVAYNAPTSVSGTSNAAVQDLKGNDALTFTARTVTNSSTFDDIPPVFQSASVASTGTVLILNYNETLSATVAGPGAFTVMVGAEEMAVASVATSGMTVRLTMSGLIIKGKVVTVKYYSPTSFAPMSLALSFPVQIMSTTNEATQDVAGNDAISLNTTNVTNGSTIDQTPPTLVSATVNAVGNTIALLFDETLSSTTAPLSSYYVMVDGVPVTPTARSVSGSTVTLTLPSVLLSTQVVTVSYAPPAPETVTTNLAVQDPSGNDAESFSDVIAINLSTTGPPVVRSAVLNTGGTSLTLTMTENLGGSLPPASLFTVYVDGAPMIASGWSVGGTVFTLNLPSAITSNRVVTVSYDAPDYNSATSNQALQDSTGDDTPSFEYYPVENRSTIAPDLSAPILTSATVGTNGLLMTLAYNEALSTTTPTTDMFTVLVDGATTFISSVTGSGSNLLLNFTSPIPAGAVVTVEYAAPTVNNSAINAATQDVAGNDAASLTPTNATNNSTAGPDIAPPTLMSVAAVNSTVTLTFNEALASATAPASNYYVYVGNEAYPVTATSVSGNRIILTVDTVIPAGTEVVVSYTPPPTESPKTATNAAIQDALGNDALAFNGSTQPDSTIWTWQTPSTGATAGCTGRNFANRTKQVILPNGVTYSVGVTGDYLCLGEQTESLSERGGRDEYFTATGLTTEPGLYVQTSNSGCLADALCLNRGVLTFTFSEPVTNPVISFAGWGGGSGGSVSWTELDLLTPGVTLNILSGTNLELLNNGTYLEPLVDNPSISCSSTSGYGANAQAGCGSVQVLGTVTTVSFQANLGTARGIGFVDGWNLVASIPEDFGLVPVSYDNPVASHVVGNLRMGAVVTPDQASSLYATANGDAVPRETPIPTVTSGTRVPDDGVTLGPALSTQSAGSSYSINVALAGVEHEAYLCAWIDFNQDEIFNPSERACAPNPQTGATSATITWTVPADIAAGLTYARVRLSYDPLPLPSGKVGSGEVEDYSLNIAAVVTPTATNDTSTGPHDTDQIITILANDVPVTGRTYVASTVELCTTNAGGQNLQCSKDPLVVADVGTYSVNNNGTVTFDPLPTFSGTAPAVTYQVEDSTGAEVTATIIVTVLPPIAATPEVLQVIPGGTIVYNNITGDTPLATGTNLNTSLTCLINPATLACDADDTFVILGEGTWTLDRATGLATFVAFGTITPGTKTAVTYQVTDAIGQTARSTLTPIVPPPPDAANDISSDAYDVTQTISPLLNDTAGTGATLVATSVKLCDPFSSPVQVPNGCTLSTLNVSGVGLYTVNSDGTVTFNPDETFAGTATPVTYQMADSTGQIDSATITVTVTPPPINATPQVKTLLPGTSTTYTNITGTSSLAAGTQLDTSKTCLVDPSTLDCGISVTIPFEGTWTLDRPSGVATFASLPGITAGVKTPVTYKVTDIVGQTATSTLTPIIPPPPGAYNDVSSGPYDTNQVISPLLNDSPGSGATLVLTSLKLCQVDDPATTEVDEAQTPNGCTATTVVVPGQGVYTLNEDGTVTFNPDDTFTGPATPLRYQVADSSGQIVTATITPSVTPPPAPTATDDVSSGLFDTNQTIPVQSNDTAGTGSALVASTLKLCQVDDPATSPANEAQSPNNCTAISVTIPGEGTYSVVNGTVVFDPLSTFTGTVQTPVVYQIADKTGQIDSATITPTVVPPPTATNDTSSDLFNVTQTISPLTNDAPGAGNTLVPSTLKLCDPTTTPAQTPNTCSATTVTIPNVGVYTVVNGTVVFNPDDTYSGTPQALTYQVADTSTQITSATISVTVAPPVLPDAKNDVSTGAYNINQIISPLANDVPGSVPFVSSTLKLCQVDDPTTSPANEAQAPDDCTATSVTIPGEGTYTVNANGTVTFDPADTFRGTVQTPVTYQVADTLGNIDSATITPTVTPPPPPSALPETQTVIPGGTATFNNITGDTPLASGVSLDVSKTCLIDPATLLCDPNDEVVIIGEGTWTLNRSTGVATFTAFGTITDGTKTPITYKVTDITGQTATSTLTPIVPPPPDAKNDTKTGPYDTNQTINILTNDIDSTGDAIDPDSTVTLCDTTQVAPACDKTTVTTSEGTYTLVDGVVTFDPLPSFSGTATAPVTYVVTDSTGQKDSALITPTVGLPNPPVANPDTESLIPGATATFNNITGTTPLATGTDLNASLTCLINPATLACDADNTFVILGEGTWTLNPSTGVATFTADETVTPGTKTPVTYQVTDAFGQTATSTLTPTILPPPDATNDTNTGPYDTVQLINLVDNDTPGSGTLNIASIALCDPNTTPAQIPDLCEATNITIAGEGSYTLNPDGTVTFDPLPTFTGSVTRPITYQIEDSTGQYDSATITPTVLKPPAPVATPEVLTVIPTGTITYNNLTGVTPLGTGTLLQANATCLIDPATLACDTNNTFTILGEGTWTLNPATQEVTFVAEATIAAGTRTAVTYQITDAFGQTATSTLTPIVPPPPGTYDDVSTGAWDTNQTITPLTNDLPGSSNSPFVASTLRLCGADDPDTAAIDESTPNNCEALTLTVAGQGTYTVNADGTVTFDPLSSFAGTATPITYQVSDTTGQTDSSTITPTVTPPPLPIATPDTETVIPGATATFNNITGTAPLATGTLLDATKTCLVNPATNACGTTVTILNEGTYTLDPTTGVVTFVALSTITPGTKTSVTYRVTDVTGQTASSTLTPNVPPPPSSTNDVSSGAWNTDQTISILTNDVDSNGSPIASTAVVKLCAANQVPNNCAETSVTTSEGVYSLVNGVVTFDPDPTFSGTVKVPVTYQVTDSTGQIDSAIITPTVALPPVPVATPEVKTLLPGASTTFDNITTSGVANDSQLADGTMLQTAKTCIVDPATTICGTTVTIPNEGTFTLNQTTGVVTFQSEAGIAPGTKTPITYQVTDVVGQTASSTLTPIIPPPPDAKNDVSSGAYDTNQTITILTNDLDSTGAPIASTAVVKLCASNQVPNNCAETTVTTSEGVYSLVNGVVTFDPDPTFSGTAKFPVTYQVTDSTGQIDSATITPTVTPPPVPVATPEVKTLLPGTSTTFNNITGDTPLATGTLLQTSQTCLINPATQLCDTDNAIVILGEGTWTLDRATGIATFAAFSTITPGTKTAVTYQVTDAFGQTASSTLTPIIPSPPDAKNDVSSGAYDTNQTITILTNDLDSTGAPIASTAVVKLCDSNEVPNSCTATTVTTSEGVYSLVNGVVTFDPEPTFSGTAQSPVTYQVTDSTGQIDSATITPTVTPPPVPVATPEVITLLPGETATYNNITGTTPLATGTLLDTTKTCFIDTATGLCIASDTITVAGEGTWTLDRSSGVATFVSLGTITPGTKTAVTYQVTDAFGQTATSTLTPIVPPPPEAEDDYNSGLYDTNQVINILTNDSPTTGETLVISSVKLCATNQTPNNCSADTVTTSEGTYSLVNGVVTFDPLPTFTGPTKFPVTYQVTDTSGQTASATINPTVGTPNQPVANPETLTVIPGGTATYNNLTGDTPLASGTLLQDSKTCLIDPATLACDTDNSITILGEGVWTLDPVSEVVTFVASTTVTSGTKTSVTYRVTDAFGQSATSTLTPIVPPPPDVKDDFNTDAYDTNQAIAILANDVNSNGSVFATNSTVLLCGTGETPNTCTKTTVTTSEGTYTVKVVNGVTVVEFDPVNTFTGTVQSPVTYQTTDATGQKDSALITPTVLPPAKPVATPDTELVIPGATATFNNITGDTPLATGTLLDATKTCIINPATNTCGTTVTILNEGTFTLDPTTGVVTFVAQSTITPGTKTPITYRVTDVTGQTATSTLTPIVPPPPSATDDVKTGPYDTNQIISILTNDVDSAGTVMASTSVVKLCSSLQTPNNCSAASVTVTNEGTYTLNADGTVTFDPLPTFTGTVKTPVTYQVTDSTGQIDSALITPTVIPPPPPVATPDTESVIPGATATFNNITGDTPLATGTLLDATKTCIINPATNICGTTVNIPNEGVFTLNPTTGVVTFVASSTITPGTKTPITYRVTDVTGQTATSTLTPIVPPPPDVKNDVNTDAYDTNQVISILTNDLASSSSESFVASTVKLCSTGQTPNNCTATSVTITGEGTYTVNANGTVTFDPLPTFTGTVKTSVTYQVTDTTGQTDFATITPTVLPPPAPTATDDFSVGPYNTSQTLVPISNDTPGADGAPLKIEPIKLCTAAETPVNCSATTVSVAGEGTYTVKPDGGVMFTPLPTFTKTATPVLYQTQDLLGRFVFATLNPAVMPPPPPDINDDLQTTAYDINQTYSPLVNDAPGVNTAPFVTTSMKLCQIDNPLTTGVNEAQQQPSCTASTVIVPGEGTYSITSTGVVVFDPLPTFTGTVATSVTYQVTDIAGQVGTATITPTITPPPLPVATPDTEPVLPGQTIAFNNITGSTPLATGTQLDATKTCIVDPATNICGVSVNIPNEGTFTLDPTTGVVSFVALNTITSGTKTSVTYKVTDITGQTATSTLTPIVPPPPSATDDYSSGPLDTNQTLTPFTNDAFTSDAPASNNSLKLCGTGETPNTCTKTSLTVSGEGVYTVNANGTVTFDPEPTFVGTATPVRYQATDVYNRPVTALLHPSVTAPSGPVATPETKLMTPGSTATFTNVVGANALATGSQLQTGPTNGPCLIDPATGICGTTVTIANEGTWTIDQSTGIATFASLATITPGTKTPVTYKVTDVLGRTATSTLTPIIPEPPTATNDAITDKYDTNQVYKPLDNDTFSSLSPVVLSTLKLCATGQLPNVCDATTFTIDGEGTYTVNTDGTVTFDPLPTFVGTATPVTYQVSNTLGQTVSATITPTVIPPPLPVANIDTGTTRQGKTIVFSPWLNDAAAQVSTSDTANLVMVARTLRLCPINMATKADVIVVPKANPACTLTKLTTKDGTYTVDTKTGKVTFVHKKGFFGTVTQPVTYQIATNWVGPFGNAHATSQIIPTIIPRRIPAASVGDKVWRDVNGDGYQNKKDRGIPGVKVTLLTINGKPVTDLFGNRVKPQLTNKDGKYRFDDLPAGQYMVRVKYPPKQRPTIAERPGRERNSSSRQAISRYLRLGQHDGSLDFGMVGPWLPGLPRTM